MRLQSQLGKVHYNGREDMMNSGMISIGRVRKIYEKTNQADVLMLTNNFLGDNNENEGLVSCFKMEEFGGWDHELQVAYGAQTPIHLNDLVVVAYADGMKGRPIIMGVLPKEVDEALQNTPAKNADEGYPKEKNEMLSVARMQDYTYYNALHEFEKASNTRAFLIGRRRKITNC